MVIVGRLDEYNPGDAWYVGYDVRTIGLEGNNVVITWDKSSVGNLMFDFLCIVAGSVFLIWAGHILGSGSRTSSTTPKCAGGSC